jgi:hypothetical protein
MVFIGHDCCVGFSAMWCFVSGLFPEDDPEKLRGFSNGIMRKNQRVGLRQAQKDCTRN